MEVNFNVEGEFITDLARRLFYEEKKPFSYVNNLLLSCMSGTNIPKETLETYVEDILKFKRKFVGSTKDDSFFLVDDNEPLPDYINTKNLDNYYERVKNPGKENFSEYGFITPQGEFIRVPWSEHTRWASDYIKKHYSIEERLASNFIYSSDFLVNEKGWLLLHHPQQGEAILDKGKMTMTKAQRETLYDYYIFFDRIKEANDLYKDDYNTVNMEDEEEI